MIILGAGQGTRLRPLTNDRPKCMIELAGRPLIEWQVRAALELGIERIVVVCGYRDETIRVPGVTRVRNPRYESTNMVYSLWCAREHFGQGILISYGDIAYETPVLESLLGSPHPAAVVVDAEWRPYWEKRFADPLADAESLATDERGRITSIGQKVRSIGEIEAQYIGLLALRGEALDAARSLYENLRGDSAGGGRVGGKHPDDLFMTDLLQALIDEGTAVRPVPIRGGWVEIDSLHDLELARSFAREENARLRIRRNRPA